MVRKSNISQSFYTLSKRKILQKHNLPFVKHNSAKFWKVYRKFISDYCYWQSDPMDRVKMDMTSHYFNPIVKYYVLFSCVMFFNPIPHQVAPRQYSFEASLLKKVQPPRSIWVKHAKDTKIVHIHMCNMIWWP